MKDSSPSFCFHPNSTLIIPFLFFLVFSYTILHMPCTAVGFFFPRNGTLHFYLHSLSFSYHYSPLFLSLFPLLRLPFFHSVLQALAFLPYLTGVHIVAHVIPSRAQEPLMVSVMPGFPLVLHITLWLISCISFVS